MKTVTYQSHASSPRRVNHSAPELKGILDNITTLYDAVENLTKKDGNALTVLTNLHKVYAQDLSYLTRFDYPRVIDKNAQPQEQAWQTIHELASLGGANTQHDTIQEIQDINAQLVGKTPDMALYQELVRDRYELIQSLKSFSPSTRNGGEYNGYKILDIVEIDPDNIDPLLDQLSQIPWIVAVWNNITQDGIIAIAKTPKGIDNLDLIKIVKSWGLEIETSSLDINTIIPLPVTDFYLAKNIYTSNPVNVNKEPKIERSFDGVPDYLTPDDEEFTDALDALHTLSQGRLTIQRYTVAMSAMVNTYGDIGKAEVIKIWGQLSHKPQPKTTLQDLFDLTESIN